MSAPRQIGSIAAMNAERLIGIGNDIPWHYPEDFKRFKRVTLGSTIIMGRKTWESIGSNHLPKRQNIVLTRSQLEGITCATSIDSAIDLAHHEQIWFIGGGHVYQQALPYCDLLDITWMPDQINVDAKKNPVYFPKISESIWRACERKALQADPRLQTQRFSRRQ